MTGKHQGRRCSLDGSWSERSRAGDTGRREADREGGLGTPRSGYQGLHGHDVATFLTPIRNDPRIGSAPALIAPIERIHRLGETEMRGIVFFAAAVMAGLLSQPVSADKQSSRAETSAIRTASSAMASRTSSISSSTMCTFGATTRTCRPTSNRCPTC